MAWSDPVDFYCERAGEGWFTEPLNALSNIAFGLAAWSLWRMQTRVTTVHELPFSIHVLPWLLFGIGIASLAFHIVARVWTGWLDSVAILLFCCTFIYAFMRTAADVPRSIAWLTAIAFAAVSLTVSMHEIGTALNRSTAYIPNLLGLFAVTLFVRRRAPHAFRAFLLASATVSLAVLTRTADLTLCAAFPLGTHFIWHVLAALVLLQVGRALTVLAAPSNDRSGLPCGRAKQHDNHR